MAENETQTVEEKFAQLSHMDKRQLFHYRDWREKERKRDKPILALVDNACDLIWLSDDIQLVKSYDNKSDLQGKFTEYWWRPIVDGEKVNHGMPDIITCFLRALEAKYLGDAFQGRCVELICKMLGRETWVEPETHRTQKAQVRK